MMVKCPMGHTENIGFEELLGRLEDDDFSCRSDGCVKEVSYEVDSVFWDCYLKEHPEVILG